MISASDCLDKAPHYNLLAGCIEDSIGRTQPRPRRISRDIYERHVACGGILFDSTAIDKPLLKYDVSTDGNSLVTKFSKLLTSFQNIVFQGCFK